jgi:hypothetical protein
MSLKLKKFTKGGVHDFVAEYELTHSLPGRQGTTLTLTVVAKGDHHNNPVTVSIPDLAPSVVCDNGVEEALDKLAEWMERAALTIRKRGKPSMIIGSYKGEE